MKVLLVLLTILHTANGGPVVPVDCLNWMGAAPLCSVLEPVGSRFSSSGGHPVVVVKPSGPPFIARVSLKGSDRQFCFNLTVSYHSDGIAPYENEIPFKDIEVPPSGAFTQFVEIYDEKMECLVGSTSIGFSSFEAFLFHVGWIFSLVLSVSVFTTCAIGNIAFFEIRARDLHARPSHCLSTLLYDTIYFHNGNSSCRVERAFPQRAAVAACAISVLACVCNGLLFYPGVHTATTLVVAFVGLVFTVMLLVFALMNVGKPVLSIDDTGKALFAPSSCSSSESVRPEMMPRKGSVAAMSTVFVLKEDDFRAFELFWSLTGPEDEASDWEDVFLPGSLLSKGGRGAKEDDDVEEGGQDMVPQHMLGSPIALRRRDVLRAVSHGNPSALSPIELDFPVESGTVRNRTQCAFSCAGAVARGGPIDGSDAMSLTEVHFHVPAEHTIDGTTYAMEMHARYYAANRPPLVVAYLFEEVDGHEGVAFVSEFLRGCRDRDGETYEGTVFGAPPRVDGSDTYFTYTGSSTTPPYTPGVQWVVFSDPLPVTPQQLASMQRYAGPRRPLQQTLGREIKFFSGASTYTSAPEERNDFVEQLPTYFALAVLASTGAVASATLPGGPLDSIHRMTSGPPQQTVAVVKQVDTAPLISDL